MSKKNIVALHKKAINMMMSWSKQERWQTTYSIHWYHSNYAWLEYELITLTLLKNVPTMFWNWIITRSGCVVRTVLFSVIANHNSWNFVIFVLMEVAYYGTIPCSFCLSIIVPPSVVNNYTVCWKSWWIQCIVCT